MITLIEATVIGYLSRALETDHVYAERPAQPPAEYYIVELTSSAEENHIQKAMIAIQSISGASLLRAAEMNKATVKAMRQIIQEEDVSNCRLNSAYNFTDTDTRQYRYQAVFDLTYMEGD